MENLKLGQRVFVSLKLVERAGVQQEHEQVPWHLGSLVNLNYELNPGRPYLVQIAGDPGSRTLALSDDDLRQGRAYIVMDPVEIFGSKE